MCVITIPLFDAAQGFLTHGDRSGTLREHVGGKHKIKGYRNYPDCLDSF